MLRYLNMFVIIGLILVGIAIAGFLTGSRLLLEPGQPVNAQAALIYLGGGVIMLVNGWLTIKNPPPVQPKHPGGKEVAA